MNNEMMPTRSAQSELATTKKEALTTRKRKAKQTAVDLATINAVNELTPEETFALLTKAIRKEADDRNDFDKQLITAQTEFTIALLLRAKEENARLDADFNQRVEAAETMNRQALADVQSIFNDAWKNRDNTVAQMNQFTPEAAMILESIGSSDPND
jgi:hypothetical protein